MSEDTVVLLTGGWGNGGRLSSNEVYPSASGCTPPSLPAGRSGHVLFTTPEPNPIIAVCGGWDGSGLASCLTLDVENKRWDNNTMGPLTMTRRYHAVVTLKNIGNYVIGGYWSSNRRTTDFLAQGSREWEVGPEMTFDMNRPCAVVISDNNFLAIYGNDIREYEVNLANPTSDSGWQQSTKWPQLQTSRFQWPGCIKIDKKVIVSGGFVGGDLATTEILDLETRKIEFAGELATPRGWFHISKIVEAGLERYPRNLSGARGHERNIRNAPTDVKKPDPTSAASVRPATARQPPRSLSSR